MILPEAAKPLAFYDHPFFGKYPALTRNAFGKGTVTYQGTVLSDTLQEKVVADVLKQAGIVPEAGLPAKVRARQAVARDGKALRFYLNYSASRSRLCTPTAPGRSSCPRSRWRRASASPSALGPRGDPGVSAALLDGTTAAGAVLVLSLVAALGLALAPCGSVGWASGSRASSSWASPSLTSACTWRSAPASSCASWASSSRVLDRPAGGARVPRLPAPARPAPHLLAASVVALAWRPPSSCASPAAIEAPASSGS